MGGSRKDDHAKDKVIRCTHVKYLVLGVEVYAKGADSVSTEPLKSFSFSLRSLAFALASRTTGSLSVAEAKSGTRNGA